MRLQGITLRWFRGAAEDATLPLDGQCALIYGNNGSGKSSFVDAVEYVINRGRLGHLRHEHSGAHQEKGCINTHRPTGKETSFTLTLDGAKVDCRFMANGSSDPVGTGLDHVRSWEYRRTILRQHEVSQFIDETKGGKYSALLPLLGLDEFEVCAENIHQLVARVTTKPEIGVLQTKVEAARAPRAAAFNTATEEEIEAAIAALHATYCALGTATTVAGRCDEISKEVDSRILSSVAESRRYSVLLTIAQSTLAEDVSSVRDASVSVASASEPLISQRLDVLASTDSYVGALPPAATTVVCPACGTTVLAGDFRDHVATERARLSDAVAAHEKRRLAISALVTTVRN